MKNLMRKLGVTLNKNQKGFTLVELLVVVAIIVALAAVVVPLTVQFASKAELGASAGELDTVQTVMDAAMADQLVLVVTAASGLASSVSDFVTTPAEITGGLDKYMRKSQTTYQFCWDASGTVTHPTAGPTLAGASADCP